MSYSFYSIGKKSGVQKVLREATFNGHTEEKNLVEHFVVQMPDDAAIEVDCQGSGYDNVLIAKLQVKKINFIE